MAIANPKHPLTMAGTLFTAVVLIAVSCVPTSAQQTAPGVSVSMDMEIPNPGTDAREDLTDLSLVHSNLKITETIPGGVEETADFTREFYQVQWRAGDPIEIYVIKPKGVTKPPVTVYLYGYPVDENRFRNPEFCKLVTRGGMAAIGFVPAMVGQRYHNVPMSKWFVSELHDSIVRTVHDVQMIVTYASERPDLDAHRVGIFGQGAGATIAGLAATVDPRIKVIDLLDPWGDWPQWMAKSTVIPEAERATFLKQEFLAPLVPLDPVNWLPQLANQALKLDDAIYETATPPAAKARIDAALPVSALLIRYNTKADFESNAIAEGKLVSWIREQLLQMDITSEPHAWSWPDAGVSTSDFAYEVQRKAP